MIDKSSCQPREPFMKLGSGVAPGLNYNLPQKTAFSVYGRIPSGIPATWFQDYTLNAPKDNWWTKYANVTFEQIKRDVTSVLTAPFSSSAIVRNTKRLRTKPLPLAVKLKTRAEAAVATPIDAQIDSLASGIRDGLMPVATQSFGGATTIAWIPKPVPRPSIYIVEEYSVASFLGDYGAGKTVSTFSLLPGETTTISIRTYSERSETATQSENVLDSFTQESADEFEVTLSEETGASDGGTTTSGSTSSGDVGLRIDLFGLIEVGGGYEGDGGGEVSVSRESFVNTTSSALEKHITKTSSFREVEVNTSSTTTVTTGTENSISRQLENINKTCVLNFVFRQLQQEYITITFLKSVRFLYTNGFPESVEIVDIPKLEGMLRRHLKQEHVKSAMTNLLKPYCVVYNHKGDAIPFIEQVTEKRKGCPFAEPGEEISYWRVRRGLKDEVTGIVVPGPILKVDQHILRTPALIVDSLLGGGPATDCYNTNLQDATVTAAHLENDRLTAALTLLNEIPDAKERADAYQKLFYPPVAEEEDSE